MPGNWKDYWRKGSFPLPCWNARRPHEKSGRWRAASLSTADITTSNCRKANCSTRCRYSYVLNNPTNLIDPTGFSSESPTQQVVIAGQKDSKTDSGSQMYSDYSSFTATLDVFPYTGPGSLVAVLTSSRKKPGVQMGSPHKVFRFRSANNGQQAMTLPMAAVGAGLIVSTMCMATSGCAEWVREQLKTLSDPFFNSGNGDRAPSLSRDFPGTNSATGSPPPDDDDDDHYDDEPKKRGEKGQTFRGGKKSQRDNWYGQNDKDFQKWWHREGKADFNGGRDIQNSQNAQDAMKYWKDIGKPVPK